MPPGYLRGTTLWHRSDVHRRNRRKRYCSYLGAPRCSEYLGLPPTRRFNFHCIPQAGLVIVFLQGNRAAMLIMRQASNPVKTKAAQIPPHTSNCPAPPHSPKKYFTPSITEKWFMPLISVVFVRSGTGWKS